MSAPDKNQALILSVLDRLLDANPEQEQDRQVSRGQALSDLRQAVRRDLEHLLNTRQRCLGWGEDLGELESSVFNYGVPDISSFSVTTEGQRMEILRRIERTIRQFEPRFERIAVVPLENVDALDRTLRFRIEALIHADPAPEPVVFDSILDPASRCFAVMGKSE